MKAIIYFSMSKKKRCLKIANELDGDIYEIKPAKKPIRFFMFQLLVYGYLTVFNKDVLYINPEINFDKYDEIILISPVWSGRMNIFMKKYLENVSIVKKDVRIIGSCDVGYNGFFESFEAILDRSNNVISKEMYVKGKLV